MNKKLLFGVGINDVDYVVRPTVNGRQSMCPVYRVWTNMLKRCYCDKYHAENPTYIGCSVSKDWHSFSTFRAWMIEQDWQGNQLDKDLLTPGNKVYGPQSCVFVDKRTNTLLSDSAASRGDLPIGVTENGKGYRAQCNSNGRYVYLGTYDTPEDAHIEYKEFKAKLIMEAALRQSNPRVQDALFLRSLAMTCTLPNRNTASSK